MRQLRHALPQVVAHEEEGKAAETQRDQQHRESSATHTPRSFHPAAHHVARRHHAQYIGPEDGEHAVREEERLLHRMWRTAKLLLVREKLIEEQPKQSGGPQSRTDSIYGKSLPARHALMVMRKRARLLTHE
jgi:hypothetical protein